MKPHYMVQHVLVFGGVIGLLFFAEPAFAQNAEKVQELQRVIDAQQKQLDAQNYYTKAGWLTRFFPIGETAFGVDYTRSLNLPTDSDDGYSVGAAAVQFFEEYGTEVYLLYRLHSLDRDVAPNVQDISVVSLGARVKF